MCAHYPEGREVTVSLRDLAPLGEELEPTSLIEGYPQDALTDYEETDTWFS